MHCRDAELKRLIALDATQLSSMAIEAHLEQCELCQSRLSELAGAEPLTQAMVTHLRTAELSDLEWCPVHSTVSIEPSSLLSTDVAVDIETVDLHFLERPSHPELLGRLGRYDVERVIGCGGMGIVLKAHDGELNRVVAIKVLAPHLAHSSAARRRFSREARAAAAVLHPNVLPIFNVESEGQHPYFVMQYVAGQSLQARVDRDGPLEIPVALRIARQTASALTAAHAQGLVHRDVKPANILLEAGVDRAQLSDFGLARTADDASLTRTGIVAGTPHYMSPEQASGEPIDARSDLFSLGCTLYFMLAARPPFRAESTLAVLNRICHHPHRPLSSVNASVPKELSQLVDRLLAKRPGRRFDSTESVESALDQMLVAVQEGRVRFAHSSRTGPHWRSWGLGLAAAIFLAALLTTTFLSWSDGSNKSSKTARTATATSTHAPVSAAATPEIAAGRSQLNPPSEEESARQPSPTDSLAVAEPAFDPIQIFTSEDQWKREANELAAKLTEALGPRRSWSAEAIGIDQAFELQIQSLTSQLEELKSGANVSP